MRRSRIYEVHAGSWWRDDPRGTAPDWDRAGRPAGPLRRRAWASPMWSSCRSWSTRSAAPGAISRWPVRADRALRPARGLRAFRRPLPRGRHRRDPRLGAGAFPDRCARPGALRRHARCTSMPTRARGSTRTGTPLIYNFGRNEVRGFLIASALHWLEHSTSTACASMRWPRCSTATTRRKAGEWIPNRYGGRENLEAVAFLQELNAVVAERCPGAMMIAEECTAWPGVTAAVARRRARLQLQMEHGVDARHPALHRAGPGQPQVPPRRA